MKEVETYSAKQQGTILLNANELYCNISKAIRQEIAEEIVKLPFHRYPDETSRESVSYTHLKSQRGRHPHVG